MSATEQIRALLDEFMGTTRDGGEAPISFEDTRVCKSYLLDSCPHEILSGTALEHLQLFIRDSDHRTELAKAKLRETQEELTDEAQQKAETINALSEQIGTKLSKAEQLGADGHVEESLELMREVESCSIEKSKFETELRTAIPTSTYQQQKLRVCEVCSAYLGIHDNDRRLADHFGGKLHLGFIEIREKLDQMKAYVEENQIVRKRRFGGYSRATFNRETEKFRDGARRRERSGERRRRSRTRSRSRSRSRHRSSRHHSSKSNGKHSRDRRHRSSRDRSEDHK